ncbi:MAG: hypothetical protein C0507_13190 [Cyanobacteria bacterium PR.3.49]|nr:hypothetical protein [Cyanobacteria bacterium PR.3.49]
MRAAHAERHVRAAPAERHARAVHAAQAERHVRAAPAERHAREVRKTRRAARKVGSAQGALPNQSRDARHQNECEFVLSASLS